MSDAKLPISRNGGDPGEKKCAMISRRNFLSLLAPLPLLSVVGPHMLLSEKPKRLGWTPALTPSMSSGGATLTVPVSTGELSPSDFCVNAISNARS